MSNQASSPNNEIVSPPRPGPLPGAGEGINLDSLRTRIDELLDVSATAARLTTLPGTNADCDEEPERLLEVTDDQLEALSQAHEELAEALASLDDTH